MVNGKSGEIKRALDRPFLFQAEVNETKPEPMSHPLQEERSKNCL